MERVIGSSLFKGSTTAEGTETVGINAILMKMTANIGSNGLFIALVVERCLYSGRVKNAEMLCSEEFLVPERRSEMAEKANRGRDDDHGGDMLVTLEERLSIYGIGTRSREMLHQG